MASHCAFLGQPIAHRHLHRRSPRVHRCLPFSCPPSPDNVFCPKKFRVAIACVQSLPGSSVGQVDSSQSDSKRTIVAGEEVTTGTVKEDLLSPMMREYVLTKRRLCSNLCTGSNRTLLLMYRVGDFFESFFEDAYLISRTCEIALTSKEAGKALGMRIPMAGLPHFAIDDKIKTIIAANISVAVVDQMQAASQTSSGQLVKREVTRLVTPATVNQDGLLDSGKASYVAAVFAKPPSSAKVALLRKKGYDQSILRFQFGFAYADMSTGEFRTTEGEDMEDLRRLLVTLVPAELLFSVTKDEIDLSSQIIEEASQAGVPVVTRQHVLPYSKAQDIITDFHNVDSVESLDCREKAFSVQAAAMAISFIQQTLTIESEQTTSPQLNKLTTFSPSDFMMLDASCIKNLEVLKSMRDGSKERSLQWAVDRTVTSMGTRCLRSWLLRPSMSLEVIEDRQHVVDTMLKNGQALRGEVQGTLRGLADLERLGGRVGTGRITPRELRWLCESILKLPSLFDILRGREGDQFSNNSHASSIWFSRVESDLLNLSKEACSSMFVPAPSFLVSEVTIQGGALAKENWSTSAVRIFKEGYDEKLDELRKCVEEPEGWISALEEREREKTKIDAVRIKHIKNVGYVLRVPRASGERMMDEDSAFFTKLGYNRVQSTKAEIRFQFEELKEYEKRFNVAVAEMLVQELRLFADLCARVAVFVQHLRALGSSVAAIDVLTGFAQVAEEQQFVKPDLFPATDRVLKCDDARHPVVEQMLGASNSFVPNSFELGGGDDLGYSDMMLLCGPNAAGKSCALRSVGLIAILAQIGSFVPAKQAKLSLCDRIFTRVGAVDDVARGQSTFQVEMAETACILSHATSSSLVLLDEIGRGTSTVDGIAIAWSVAEHLSQRRCNGIHEAPRAMFVTHFHELNHLSNLYKNIQSFHIKMVSTLGSDGASQEDPQIEVGGWISTHCIVPGPSYVSLGLDLAERAGFPSDVVARAREVAGILAMPSKLLGSELQSALGTRESNERDQGLKSEGCDGREVPKGQYETGFEDGYQKALQEISAKLQQMETQKVDAVQSE